MADSKYSLFLEEEILLKEQEFYTLFNGDLVNAKLIGLSGDYAILSLTYNGKVLNIHCHVAQVQVIFES
ncbi:hypothetical protein [Thiomicrorhabdus sp.]|uniref:hypothetical protein n=1 Tax=Thiomicrorhabdus sp. TaxID=2039724 RepID=UPI0029C871E7|nr:hypothetical protein [Thiomicrorhabdus sp.]